MKIAQSCRGIHKTTDRTHNIANYSYDIINRSYRIANRTHLTIIRTDTIIDRHYRIATRTYATIIRTYTIIDRTHPTITRLYPIANRTYNTANGTQNTANCNYVTANCAQNTANCTSHFVNSTSTFVSGTPIFSSLLYKIEADSPNFNISLAIYLRVTTYFRVSIVNKNSCTMLSLNLSPIFKARGIESPHALLVKAGIHSATANRILYSNVRGLRLDHIEKLCKILICEPQDLLLWTPDKDEPLAATHPLHNLKQQEQVVNWKETLDTMPYKQLKQVTKAIVENANTGM